MAQNTTAEMLKQAEVTWADGGTYPVLFAEKIFAEDDKHTATLLRRVAGTDRPRMLIVADTNVVQYTEGLGTRIGQFIKDNNIALLAPPVVLLSGERAKSGTMSAVQKIIHTALDAKMAKNDILLVLGGGSVLDVANFAATIICGGVKLVRVPTTPAAIIDSAFATEAYLNSETVKDALRVPSHPAAVIIDPAFCPTVLDGVWRAGVGALVRHAAVKDAELMRDIAAVATKLRDRANSRALMFGFLRRGAASRIQNGDSDFALWSAERLESMSDYKLPHGYAVGIGICIDTAYAVERRLLSERDQEFICRALADSGALDGLGPSRHLMTQIESVLAGLDTLKLLTGREARTLPVGVGECKVEDKADREAYRKVLHDFLTATPRGRNARPLPGEARSAAKSPDKEAKSPDAKEAKAAQDA